MASPSQRPKGRDGVLSTLDLVIQGLHLAKGTCGFPPAQVALGAASALLTMIRVRSLLSHRGGPPVHVCSGLRGQQTGLRRPWAGVRRCMQSHQSGFGRETIGGIQPVCGRSDRRTDRVGRAVDVYAEWSAHQVSIAGLWTRSGSRSSIGVNGT